MENVKKKYKKMSELQNSQLKITRIINKLRYSKKVFDDISETIKSSLETQRYS